MRIWLTLSHICVLGAVIALVSSLDLAMTATGAGLAIAVGPLLLAAKGLYTGSRYTRQWLSILLVFYVGLGLVETIASQGRSVSAAVLLLASAVELGLLFASLRSAPTGSRGSGES